MANPSIVFDVAEDRKQALLKGLDEISQSLLLDGRITDCRDRAGGIGGQGNAVALS